MYFDDIGNLLQPCEYATQRVQAGHFKVDIHDKQSFALEIAEARIDAHHVDPFTIDGGTDIAQQPATVIGLNGHRHRIDALGLTAPADLQNTVGITGTQPQQLGAVFTVDRDPAPDGDIAQY